MILLRSVMVGDQIIEGFQYEEYASSEEYTTISLVFFILNTFVFYPSPRCHAEMIAMLIRNRSLNDPTPLSKYQALTKVVRI